jgi:very-short-patch-repair endonuclease
MTARPAAATLSRVLTQFDVTSRGQAAARLSLLLESQSGVISSRQASQFLSRGAIRHRVRSGRWQHPHQGILVAYRGPIGEPQRRWIVWLAVGAGQPAYLAGLTALQAHGLRGITTDEIFLLLPAQRRGGAPPPNVEVHRTTTLTSADVFRHGRPPRTMPARSVVDAARWAPTDRAACYFIAASFQQRLVRLPDVLDALSRGPTCRRGALIAAVAHDAEGGATALSELDFLALVRRAGLPEPEVQHERRVAAGRRRRLDFYFAQWRLHVEIDGAQHFDPLVAWDDMARQNEVWRSGDRILRFPSWLLRAEPETVIAHVRAALIAAGWPGR